MSKQKDECVITQWTDHLNENMKLKRELHGAEIAVSMRGQVRAIPVAGKLIMPLRSVSVLSNVT